MIYDPKQDVWHLVCETNDGRVSILKNLDERTARETYKSLRPDEAPVNYVYDLDEPYRSSYVQFMPVEKFKVVHTIGPEGVELDPWHGVEPRVVHRPKLPEPQVDPATGATIFPTEFG